MLRGQLRPSFRLVGEGSIRYRAGAIELTKYTNPSSGVEAQPDVLVRPEGTSALLEVEDLHVHFDTSRGIVRAVEGLSFHVGRGEIVAIVGESGSGKSVSALAIMRLLPRLTGQIRRAASPSKARICSTLDDEAMREMRGRDISMIFQEPMTSLNPLLTIGLQISEPLHHPSRHGCGAGAARAPSSCCGSSASPMPSAGSTSIRTSSPAACASA